MANGGTKVDEKWSQRLSTRARFLERRKERQQKAEQLEALKRDIAEIDIELVSLQRRFVDETSQLVGLLNSDVTGVVGAPKTSAVAAAAAPGDSQ